MEAQPTITGFTPFTTTDYPGCLAAVLFTQGCPWSCPYCHNPHLRPSQEESSSIGWARITRFLASRTGLLDGVVFSGGEPTLQRGLPEALREIRTLGFKTGLHTAGIYPERLASVLPLLDWVGLDIKGLPAGYAGITGAQGSAERAFRSLRLVLDSGIAYEVRTTVHARLTTFAELVALAHTLADAGVRHYALQAFRPQGCIDPALTEDGGAQAIVEAVRERIAPLFETFRMQTEAAD
ncbi:MAG: anaerobic ribonucleoside-triphosphate reductase activating protein [Betaproteobacteria bacterium]|nr:anaerobic ribonucleoside-triphosphate reductase activating protein [Betaproteobacteria bacterium]